MNEEPHPNAALPAELSASLDAEQLAAEATVWRGLTPSQRARALKRFEALKRWNNGRGELDAEAAARLADISTSRFYRIAADWRSSRSFRSLGVFARPGARKPKLDSGVVDALANAARQAILLHGDMSTSALVDRTLRLARLPSDARLPGMTKLREIVQAAARRIAASMPLGQLVLCDCVATSLPRIDRRPHLAFLCVDGGTGAVLGVAVGTIDEVIGGYARAANDALRTIEREGAQWRWSNVFSAMRVTAGEDIPQIARVMHELNAQYRETHFILEQGEKRYGRLIAKAVGPRLGRVTFTPTRTVSGDALAANGDMTPWTNSEAYKALRGAADAHNDAVLDQARAGAKEMPPNLRAALATLGGKRD